jgi:methionine-rich copper-binding protein CopC
MRWFLLACLFLFSNGFEVHAHARLVKSNPANAASLSDAPQRAELWFNELLDQNFNKVEVFEASDSKTKNRKNFARGEPQVDEKDKTHLAVELEKLQPGDYVIEYRVLSRDGHTAPGRITFKVSGSKK